MTSIVNVFQVFGAKVRNTKTKARGLVIAVISDPDNQRERIDIQLASGVQVRVTPLEFVQEWEQVTK
jgi:hypothetical protein